MGERDFCNFVVVKFKIKCCLFTPERLPGKYLYSVV